MCKLKLKPFNQRLFTLIVMPTVPILLKLLQLTGMQDFFGVLQNLYTFLEASPHRHAKLESVIKEVNSKPQIMSVKKLSDTR